MTCVICWQAEAIDGLTSVTFEREEFRLLVNGVPARVCPNCGEAYVGEAIVEQLLRLTTEKSEAGILNAQCEYRSL
jgi:YgiT-type zinc finger domain-containing protein